MTAAPAKGWPATGRALRALESAELARLGEEALREHLVVTAQAAHRKYVPFAPPQLDALLADRDLVRYPVRLEFALGTLARHQFAQPEPDADGCVLYVHPALEGKGEWVVAAVAYFLPVINYGDFINDDHCLIYGATLRGQTIDRYFADLCELAKGLGVPARDRPTDAAGHGRGRPCS